MTYTMTHQFDFLEDAQEPAEITERSTTHSLLAPQFYDSSYLTRAAAVALYALALVSFCYFAKPKTVQQDEPIELAMVTEDAPVPLNDPTPALVDPVPPEQTALAVPDTPPDQDVPPPPADQLEAVAPVPPPPPPAPVKQPVKPKPHPQAVAAHAPHPPAGGSPASASSNTLPSYYANAVYSRISRVASETVPDDFHGSARVSYHLVIAPSGAVISKTLSSSGNSLFDRAAAAALGRAAPFPPTGVSQPVSLHGVIAYSQ